MERFVKKFWTEEDGNTTIDWMVLTAGLVLLGAAAMAAIGSGSHASAQNTTAITQAFDAKTGV